MLASKLPVGRAHLVGLHTCSLSLSCHIAPSAPPTSLNVTDVTSSSITIQWGPVDCVHRNGDMTGCSVQYGVQGSGSKVNVTILGSAGSDGGTYVVTGLVALTGYDIKVAAVNSAGTGVYSKPITVFTASGKCLEGREGGVEGWRRKGGKKRVGYIDCTFVDYVLQKTSK